jgi:hypothetical protein
MRVLVVNTDYPRFLHWMYSETPGLESAPYVDQMRARNATLFGVANFYSMNFAAQGHPAAELHINNPWLQNAWAREQGMTVSDAPPLSSLKSSALADQLRNHVQPLKRLLRPIARRLGASPNLDQGAQKILLAQIEAFRPDVILNQDVFYVDTVLARRMKSVAGSVLVGQIGILPPIGQDWSVYDLIVSMLPSVVNWFRARGGRAEVAHLAFEPEILNMLPPAPERDVDVSFVGTLSGEHRQRIALLEAVAARYDLKIWGNGGSALGASSPLLSCMQGEVWGRDMYQVLRRSRVTLNSHIDLVSDEAGNMRLFEATGVETLLITDHKGNLNTLFEPDVEIAVWHSIEDCLKKIDIYLRDSGKREAVARTGQTRTLATHTYRNRVDQLLEMIS